MVFVDVKTTPLNETRNIHVTPLKFKILLAFPYTYSPKKPIPYKTVIVKLADFLEDLSALSSEVSMKRTGYSRSDREARYL
jgi:hypothetical protein